MNITYVFPVYIGIHTHSLLIFDAGEKMESPAGEMVAFVGEAGAAQAVEGGAGAHHLLLQGPRNDPFQMSFCHCLGCGFRGLHGGESDEVHTRQISASSQRDGCLAAFVHCI